MFFTQRCCATVVLKLHKTPVPHARGHTTHALHDLHRGHGHSPHTKRQPASKQRASPPTPNAPRHSSSQCATVARKNAVRTCTHSPSTHLPRYPCSSTRHSPHPLHVYSPAAPLRPSSTLHLSLPRRRPAAEAAAGPATLPPRTVAAPLRPAVQAPEQVDDLHLLGQRHHDVLVHAGHQVGAHLEPGACTEDGCARGLRWWAVSNGCAGDGGGGRSTSQRVTHAGGCVHVVPDSSFPLGCRHAMACTCDLRKISHGPPRPHPGPGIPGCRPWPSHPLLPYATSRACPAGPPAD